MTEEWKIVQYTTFLDNGTGRPGAYILHHECESLSQSSGLVWEKGTCSKCGKKVPDELLFVRNIMRLNI